MKKLRFLTISSLILPLFAYADIRCFDQSQYWFSIIAGWPILLLERAAESFGSYKIQQWLWSLPKSYSVELFLFGLGIIINLAILYLIGKCFKRINGFLLPAIYLAVTTILGLLWLSGATCIY